MKRKIQLNFCFSKELSKYCFKCLTFIRVLRFTGIVKDQVNKQTLNTRPKKAFFWMNLYLS